jgi:hypothetical protein
MRSASLMMPAKWRPIQHWAHRLCLDPTTAMDVIPLLPRVYGGPFAQSPQLPIHLVLSSSIGAPARQHVTVMLSGK